MDRYWLKEALFAGQTANGFKLGTAISRGWFWTKVSGCRLVYRGQSMEAIDFDDVLAVVTMESDEIALPGFLSHEPGQTWFYVVRCANRCGQIEQTLQSAVKAAIDTEGGICEPRPNGIFGLSAERKADGSVEVIGLYYPIEQASNPIELRVYSDGGTGQIDYQNPEAKLTYQGRKFYGYSDDSLSEGRYLFSIRAADAAGSENRSKETVMAEVKNKSIETIEIVSVERV